MSTSFLDEDGYLDLSQLDSDLLLRWSGTLQPIPLPSFSCPTGGAPLKNTPLDALMKVSPHMIVHVQRTASQGGLQTISPRQTPFSKTMIRVVPGKRQLGDHVVGSVAHKTSVWPTVDGDDMDDLLPDEPLPFPTMTSDTKPKTRTTPLTRANKLLSDPILACLVKGRAVIDLMRRSDVCGDPEAIMKLLSEAWGVPEGLLAELDAFTLGIEGDLTRHAIKVDEVYPMTYAPIHVKRCIQASVSEVTRAVLPADSAMDWKRNRVFCEAVFSLAMTIEGYVLTEIRAVPAPGEMSARTDGRNVLVFQPGPATAWCAAPSTFAICPVVTTRSPKQRGFPPEVMDALSKYVHQVKPISYAMACGHRAVAKKASAVAVAHPDMETIAEGYSIMIRSMTTGPGRGRTAAATVRNVIFTVLDNATRATKLKFVRYLTISKQEAKTHLYLNDVPDVLINKLANKFVELGDNIRSMVVAECARRGDTAEEWWADITAQAPAHYRAFVEGTLGWARVALWLAFKEPTDRWRKMTDAIRITTMREDAVMSVGAVKLPSKIGSMERVLAATRHAVREITTSFAAYYTGVADVGFALAEVAEQTHKPRIAEALREGAYLWILRARAYRGVNINPLMKDDELKSTLHTRVYAEPVDLAVAPAPYRAYEAYREHVKTHPTIASTVKMHFKEKHEPPISNVFSTLHTKILNVRSSTITKYLVNPEELGADMERGWAEIAQDVGRVAKMYGAPAPVEEYDPNKRAKVAAMMYEEVEMPDIQKQDFWTTLAELPEDQVDWVEDTVDEMPPDVGEALMTRTYSTWQELLAVVSEAKEEVTAAAATAVDTVR
jgi:hypothetical protein